MEKYGDLEDQEDFGQRIDIVSAAVVLPDNEEGAKRYACASSNRNYISRRFVLGWIDASDSASRLLFQCVLRSTKLLISTLVHKLRPECVSFCRCIFLLVYFNFSEISCYIAHKMLSQFVYLSLQCFVFTGCYRIFTKCSFHASSWSLYKILKFEESVHIWNFCNMSRVPPLSN